MPKSQKPRIKKHTTRQKAQPKENQENSHLSAEQPKSFYKYVTADTAKLILKNQTLQWSSPLNFNDYFDFPRDISAGLTTADIADAINRLIYRHGSDPTFLYGKNAYLRVEEYLHLVKLIHQTNQLPQPFRKQFEEGLKKVGFDELRDDLFNELKKKWEDFLPNMRVFCMSEDSENMAMWYHYAEQYRGAVLEFTVSDNSDSMFKNVKKIEYLETKPQIYSADGWADLLTHDFDAGFQKVMEQAVYSKKYEWRYENEWRAFGKEFSMNEGNRNFYPFFPQELTAIYLGPFMTDTDKGDVRGAAKIYPECMVYETEFGVHREFIYEPPMR